MTTSSPQTDYKQEVRFAVVMYGGVSLAIYINGVAQELLKLVRSTARNGKAAVNGTERIYRKVSYLLDDETDGLANADAAGAGPNSVPPTRFVVDILSGTSAGGINGIFLAKALANGQDMEKLKDLWVKEGDIETLINDKRSVEKPLSRPNPPTSLLNSERMYFKLLTAFEAMDESSTPRREEDESPLVDELDLFVTSTDLQGVVLPIRLSDDLVYERRHRNVQHFVYSSPSISGEPTRNDFFGAYNPFLAYAARCTSSFPFAFEPMSLSDIDTLLGKLQGFKGNDKYKSSSNLWQRFYRDYLDPRGVSTVPFPKRAFGDGGYLDNKPFSYATETLMNRNADVPVDRKLIYIEPSPEHPEDDVERDQKPDAIENVMSALLTLPRYETIREDLQRLKDRNRLIDRVKAITAGVDRDEDAVNTQMQWKAPANDYESWKELGALAQTPGDHLWAREHLSDEQVGQLDLADMIKRKGRAYAAYHRLRISALTDEIARLIARVAGFDEHSDYFIVVRSMVRAWRIKTFIEHRRTTEDAKVPTANRFLFEFDLSFPLRRVNYLRSKADSLYRFESNAMTLVALEGKPFNLDPQNKPFTSKQEAAFRAEILRYKRVLNELFVSLRYAARSLRSRHKATDKRPGEPVATPSPVKAQVLNLMNSIEKTVKGLVTETESPSLILDYFLGKREADAERARSYKGQSPEDECTARVQKFLEDHPDIMALFESTADVLKENVRTAKHDAEQGCLELFTAIKTGPLSPDPEIDSILWVAKNCLGHYYYNYEDYDLLTYPILYDTDVGEADTIDIIRISPEDAKQLIDERESGCHKLAGTALGHFGAFLQKGWRENDILWGRLDGAERIITALIPNHPLRTQLIGEAHAEIICETISAMGEGERHSLLAESLMRTRTRKPEPELLDKFVEKLRENSAVNPDLKKKIGALINPNQLRQFYLDSFRTRSKVEPESALRSAARATTVIGLMLESLSSQRRVSTKYAIWIARLGQVFWSLVEVAVPQSFPNLIFRHWLKLVYFLEALLIAGSTLLLHREVQQFALTAFAITAAVHLAVVILGDLIKNQNKWINLAKAAGVVILVALIATGVLTISAILGAGFSWRIISGVRAWLLAPTPLGLNAKTFGRFGVFLVVFLCFLAAIRDDLKAVFRRARRV
jgi:patatin-related protein